jgi:hypothetical protein
MTTILAFFGCLAVLFILAIVIGKCIKGRDE